MALVLCSCKQDTGPLDRVGLEYTVSAFVFHRKGDCKSWRAWLITTRQTSEYGSGKVQLFNSSYMQSIQTSCCLSSCSFSLFSQWPLLLFSLSFSFSFLGFHNYQGRRGTEICCFWGDFGRVNVSSRSQLSSSLSILLNDYFRLTDMTRKTVIFPNKYLCEWRAALCTCEKGKKSFENSCWALCILCWIDFLFPFTSRQPQEGEVDQNIFEMVLSPASLFCSSL